MVSWILYTLHLPFELQIDDDAVGAIADSRFLI